MLDAVLRNVRLCGAGQSAVNAVGLLHGRIVALDDDAQGIAAEHVLDCDGAYLSPGFGDAHNHMLWFGRSLGEIDLANCRTAEEVYALVAAQAGRTDRSAWIIGHGYDDDRLDAPLARSALDRAASGRRVWLKHRSGHRCMVNTPVLADAGVLAEDGGNAPADGRVVRNGSGIATGLLEERAQDIITELTGPLGLEEMVQAIAEASRILAAEGLTHVVECGVGGGLIGQSPLEALAYQVARESGLLKVRVDLMPALDVLHPVGPATQAVGLDLGLRTGFGDQVLRLGPVKVWLDGAMLGRTAAMTTPFCDRGHGSGRLADDPSAVRSKLVDAHRAGWRLAMHAIGDRAVDLALDVVEEAQATAPRPDVRHRVEHAAVTRPDQVERMGRLGVVPVPQARLLYEIGDNMVSAVGSARSEFLYRHRSFLEAGIRVPGSSDRPVATGAPLLGMQAMVERLSHTGQVIGADECVDAQTALHAYTEDEAWACHDETTRGRVAPGSLADLVLLSDDPTSVPASTIGSIDVLATMMAGRPTHVARGAPDDLWSFLGD